VLVPSHLEFTQYSVENTENETHKGHCDNYRECRQEQVQKRWKEISHAVDNRTERSIKIRGRSSHLLLCSVIITYDQWSYNPTSTLKYLKIIQISDGRNSHILKKFEGFDF
jgi:hypothetical protein